MNNKTFLTIATVALVCGVALTGCGGGGSKKKASEKPISGGGAEFCAQQAIPTGAGCLTLNGRDNLVYTQAQAYKGLILTLHGAPGNMSKVAGIFDATMLRDKGYLVISPDGNGTAWEWNSKNDGSTDSNSDVQYLSQLIDHAYASYTFENTNTHILGYSAGGFMAYKLACQIPEKLTSVVSLAGQYRGYFDHCTTSTPVTVHHLHSPSDSDVPMAGRTEGTIASVEDTLAHWLAINGCDGTTLESNQDGVSADSEGTKTTTWQGCEKPVIFSELLAVPHEANYLSDKLFNVYQSSIE